MPICLEPASQTPVKFSLMPEDTGKIHVPYIADLVRMYLTEDEKAKFAAQLRDVLAYVAKLNELDVSNVEPTAHATPLSNVFRKDEAAPSIETGKIMRNAPEHARDLFIVPKILE